MLHRVLVVSAKSEATRALASELGRLGYGILEVAGEAESLRLARQECPPLVVVDAAILQDARSHFLFTLKRDCPSCQIFVLATDGQLEVALQALELEASDVLAWPLKPDELELSLRAGLDRIQLKDKLAQLKDRVRDEFCPWAGAPTSLKGKVDWLMSLERLEVAQQVVEGLSTAFRTLIAEIEGGERFFWELPCFVSIHNQERKVVATNRLASEELGDMVGRASWEMCSAQPLTPERCPINRTFTTGVSQFSRQVLTSMHGNDIPVMVYTVPVRDHEGQVTLVMAIAADMSEVKRTKNELLAMQGRYQQLFDEAPCFISVQDKDLIVTDANRRFKEAFGNGDVKHCFRLCKGRQEPCEDCPVKRTFLFGEPQSSEEVLTGTDGTQYHVLTHTSPIRDATGEITHVMEMSLDITQTKQLQRELSEVNQLHQQLFDEVPCYISVQDRNFKLTATNRRFKEDFGDEVGAFCYEIYKHRTSPCDDCPVAATFENGQPHSTEEVVTSVRGESIYTLTWTAPIRDKKGKITHVMEMSTDITQIRQMQDHLTSLGLLIGSMSHGVKGLLTGLDGGMYLMSTGFARRDEGRIEEGWQMVKLMVDRIKSTVMDILYYAKERELNWEVVDAQSIAMRVAASVRPKAKAHGIEFVEQFNDGSGRFKVDSSVLSSALVNLLENAVDACVEDIAKQDHRIIFSLGTDGSFLTFDIYDNGMGMDTETQNNLFTLFFSSKGSSGTGLGLYIAKEVIEQHGGTITVDSTPGQGTRFHVRLPAEK